MGAIGPNVSGSDSFIVPQISGGHPSVKLRKKIPVLFTEYGYRSVENCAKEPWVADRKGTVSLTAQQNAYEALYREILAEVAA